MIANINAYARVMTKNWLKQGLTMPEMGREHEEQRCNYSNRGNHAIFVENLPSWYAELQ